MYFIHISLNVFERERGKISQVIEVREKLQEIEVKSVRIGGKRIEN